MRDNDRTQGGQRLVPLLRRSLRRAGDPALVDVDSPLHVRAPDSLEITRLAVQLSCELGVTVPLRLLFECATVGELAAGIAQLAGTPDVPATTPGSGSRDRRRSRRLSFSQERMAFMQALATGSAAYHVAFGLRLRGPLDTGALTRAIESLPRRYEVLRTRFLPAAEGIMPLPVDRPTLSLRVISTDAGGAAGPEAELRIATEFCNAPFDLECGDTARAAVIRSGPETSLLVLAFHHIVIDQWSYELLLDHLSRAYAHELLGSPAPDATADTHFTDYVIRHRTWFRTHAFGNDRAYWLSQLAGTSRVTFEPDRPRGALASFRGARWRLALPERTWQQLEELALRERATLAMLLFAALALQLRNESGHSDIVIGLPIANRNHAGAPGCFGTLVNTLALRARVDGKVAFVDFLAQVRERFLEAFAHQDMPFEVLIGQLRIERDPSVSPLFGVMLNMLNTPPANVALPNLAVERVEIDRCGAQFDLTLTVDRLHTKSVWFEYATDLYEETTIDRLSQRFQNLLEAILEEPGRALDLLPQRTRTEATQVRRWSTGHAALAAHFTTYELLAAGAALRPEAVAVVSGGSTLTHAELHRRAARLASALRRETGEDAVRIGLMLGRNAGLPVALLAALRAGLSFVPLDPGFPAGRLAFIAADAGLRMILADANGLARQDWMPPGTTLRSLEELLAHDLAPLPPAAAQPGREAYVLYTSGTTGQPKGVSIPDSALANFLHTMQRRPGMRATDRLLAVTTLGFDIALLELLLPLTAGATVVIASREQARDGHELAALIEAQRISVLQATPSTWMQLVESGWHGDGSLRALVGGEPLPRSLATALLARTGELWNMYGPTESTVWSTCSRVADDATEITIGRPVGGTGIAIVDGQDRAAGIGVHGEILIGGAGLANGYVNRGDLTAERFVTLAVDGNTSRYYRTGDLGCWTAGGELRILGRLDRQLKVRGHRIEPEDIEACASRIPGIARAHVGVTAGNAGDTRLVLYVVGATAPPDPNAIRAHLRTWLPEYMIPQRIVPLPAIPTLPNGKVDHRRLAQLAAQAGRDATAAAPPQSADEAGLHRIWSELLGVGSIDREQDFFELGGHSLLAMQVVTRVREELQKNCTLAQVFRHPTIASLCRVLDEAPPLTTHTLVPLQEEGEGNPLFCLCGIQLYRPLVRALALDSPVLAAYVPPPPSSSVESLSRDYLALVRSQQPRGPYRLLGFSLGGVLAFEVARQLLSEGDEVEHLVILDSDVPGEDRLSAMKGVLRGVRRVLAGEDPAARAMPDYLRAIREYRPDRYAGHAIFVEATRAENFSPGYGWPDLIRHLTTLRVDSEHLELMSRQKAGALAAVLMPHLSRKPAGASSA